MYIWTYEVKIDHKEVVNIKTNTLVGITAIMLLLALALPAAASDYTLGIFGNANEDDTINMQDVTYTELIILEYRDKTELSDAKHDDKINMQDVTQIELVILGKEKEITLIDAADRAVTVNKPIEGGIISFGTYTPEILRVLGEQDKLVAVNKYVKSNEVYFPELSKLPSIGSGYSPDLELVASLNPELVLAWTTKPERIEALVDVVPNDCSVVSLMFYRPEDMVEETEKLAYVLGKRDEARCYIDDFHNEYIDLIKARTEGLSDAERQNIYVESDWGDKYNTWAGGSAANGFIEIAGGRNIFADTPGTGSVIVDPEKVVEKNPDIIIRYIDAADAGYEVDDPSKMNALRESVMSRPELANVNAVEDGAVYVMDKDPIYGPDYPIAIAYWAKWSHPDLFGDLDPQAIHQQYIDIQGLDYDLNEHGVFVHPPLEGS
ncbi:MAG: ABC transporter substrate-binding protein [Methanosarcinales archaeon]|nr:MAG: ABC transporter substrate-binding protein [Methanosarcinales archaeon]